MDDAEVAAGFAYTTEDLGALRVILQRRRYDVVVGNPPYITVKDKNTNKAYRTRFASVCKGTYALTVPFMVQFFWLARSGERAGWVGQITSNSFMKREFGAPLIEKFLSKIDLRLVADTSGAFIPGHGTPTVIIIGRNQPKTSERVRAVLGTRGEPRRPDDPANGQVWTSIRDHTDEPLTEGETWDNRWITVTDLDRAILAHHPWSLTGGRAPSMSSMQSRPHRISFDLMHLKADSRSVRIGADEAFFLPQELSPYRAKCRKMTRPRALWARISVTGRQRVHAA